MPVVASKILGREQLILLPCTQQVFTLTTDPPGQVNLNSGDDIVVVSGLIGILFATGEPGLLLLPNDDDEVRPWDVEQAIGPVWRAIQQVSASVSIAGIRSHDADEVDHSRWVVDDTTWDEAQVPGGGKQIRLKTRLLTQGTGNGWQALAYQVVATGYLMRMPTPDEISADLS